jgi:peptidoglycan/LPS O-acetylase OafA/YrhL
MTRQAPSSWLLRHFQRVTSSGAFFSEIDGLRCFALAAAVLFHLTHKLAEDVRQIGLAVSVPQALAATIHRFWDGAGQAVPLFFVINGFVVKNQRSPQRNSTRVNPSPG